MAIRQLCVCVCVYLVLGSYLSPLQRYTPSDIVSRSQKACISSDAYTSMDLWTNRFLVEFQWSELHQTMDLSVPQVVCVCACTSLPHSVGMTGSYFVFFIQQAFNLLFLNLPLQSVLCWALSCPRFKSEWAAGSLNTPCNRWAFCVNIQRQSSEESCWIRWNNER